MSEIFTTIPRIPYEGVGSDNPLAYRHYDPNRKIGDKTMREHLKFSVCYWHSFTYGGGDPFGENTVLRPWDGERDPMAKAKLRAEGILEFAHKLGIPFFCFHDRDIAPEGENLTQFFDNVATITAYLKSLMPSYGVKLLWGTANLFSHPRYMQGAATSPSPAVYACAAAQVKHALDATKELGGQGYVFWGGREGYDTIYNTDMRLELDNLARFLDLAREYAQSIAFSGQLLIEPKPKEPTKHQYDFDVAAVYGFLQHYGLLPHFKVNIESNHATLAGHQMEHELRMARVCGILGSVDANRGDLLLGWDTDQFAVDTHDTAMIMYEILRNGGLPNGGLNFDAKVRRASYEPLDLAYAHIGSMDAFALGLKIAHRLIADRLFEDILDERYAGYRSGLGHDILHKKKSLAELAKIGMEGAPIPASGRQEEIENRLRRVIADYQDE